MTTIENYANAYIKMATHAKYRPGAPSDGFGTILLEENELMDSNLLKKEALNYALDFSKQDNNTEFVIDGCTDFELAPITIWALEIAKVSCSGSGSAVIIKKLTELINKHLNENSR